MATNLELSVQTLTKSSGSATKALAALESQFKKTLKANTNFGKGLVNTDKVTVKLIDRLKKTITPLSTVAQSAKTAAEDFSKFESSLRQSTDASRQFRTDIAKSDRSTSDLTRTLNKTNTATKNVAKSMEGMTPSNGKFNKGAKGAIKSLSDLEKQFKRTTKHSAAYATAMIRAGSAGRNISVSGSGSSEEGESKKSKSKDLFSIIGKGVSKLSGAFGGPLTVADAAADAVVKVVTVTSEFESLEARIQTISASSADASNIFEGLKGAAEQTPHSIEQTTNAFIALANNGLTPTKEALTAYGDMATTLGMSLEEVSDSVINATSNSAKVQQNAFAALGVTAQENGELVTLTYNGITTTIQNDSAKIQEYLTQLGQNNFAGAMDKEMNTLGGRISRLGTEFDELFLNIGASSIGDLLKSDIDRGINALDVFNDALASGQLEKYAEAFLGPLKSAFSGLYKYTMGDDLEAALTAASGVLSKAYDKWGSSAKEGLKDIGLQTLLIPNSVKSAVEMADKELQHWGRYLDAATGYTFTSVKNDLTSATESLVVEFQNSLGALNPFSDSFDYEADKKKAKDNKNERDQSLKKSQENAPQALDEFANNELEDRLKGYFSYIQKDKEKTTKIFLKKVAEAEALGESYEKKAADFNKAKTNTAIGLKPPKIEVASQPLTEGAPAKPEKTELSDKSEPVVNDDTPLGNDLKKHEIALKGSCERRVDIAYEGQQKQTEIEVAETKRRHKQLAELEQQQNNAVVEGTSDFLANLQNLGSLLAGDESGEVDLSSIFTSVDETFDAGTSLYDTLFGEDEDDASAAEDSEALQASNELKLEAQKELGEQQTSLEVDQVKDKNDQIEAIENNRIQSELGASSQFYGEMAGLAKAYGGEQSKAYKGLHAVSKAYSIAQSVMNIGTGIAKAQELGFPANLAEMARVAVTGASVMATIKGSNFSGAYDHGGLIPAGKIGLVGEYGPELISGPVNVTSRRTTAGLSASNSNTDPTPQNIDKSVKFNYVINANDSEGVAQVMKKERTKILRDVRYAMESGEWD